MSTRHGRMTSFRVSLRLLQRKDKLVDKSRRAVQMLMKELLEGGQLKESDLRKMAHGL